MNVRDLIELLRALPNGGTVAFSREQFEALFRDSDRQERAKKIARLNNCTLSVDENGVATFMRIK
jgi:hypothetical protein